MHTFWPLFLINWRRRPILHKDSEWEILFTSQWGASGSEPTGGGLSRPYSMRPCVRPGCVTTNGFTIILYWVLLSLQESFRCTLLSPRVGIVAPASCVPSHRKKKSLPASCAPSHRASR